MEPNMPQDNLNHTDIELETSESLPKKKLNKKVIIAISFVAIIVLAAIIVCVSLNSKLSYHVPYSKVTNIEMMGWRGSDDDTAVNVLKTMKETKWKAFIKDLNSVELIEQAPSKTSDSQNSWIHIECDNGKTVYEIFYYVVNIYYFSDSSQSDLKRIKSYNYRCDKETYTTLCSTYGFKIEY